MNKLRSTVQTVTYSLIACAALTACTVVSITDDAPTRTPHSTTTQVVAGVPVPASVQRELDSSNAVLMPCPTEDSDDCYWDAVSRANNQGASFIAWHGHYYYQEVGQ